ncbi:MAG: ATP-binding protein [Clostridia bacterium]|nr:ATP-binding protein [Clostridia bacterium]
MAMEMDPKRQQLIEQVLEYWYTVDFLAQGGLNTEETRRDRENRSFAMSYPTRFSVLYQHTDLNPGENVVSRIKEVEASIEAKRREYLGPNAELPSPPTHGKITVYLGAIDQAFLSIAIAQELNCEPPLNPSSAKLALASLQLTNDGKYVKGTLSLSPVVWALRRIHDQKAGASMYDTLDPDEYNTSNTEFEPSSEQELVSYSDLFALTEKIIETTVVPVCINKEEAGLESGIHFTYSIYRDEREQSKRETDEYFGLSMSFYASDLAKFRNAAAQGKWFSNAMWKALADYICAPYDMENDVIRHRIDIGNTALQDPGKAPIAREALKTILAVEKSPWGKWPSKYQPFFMQQAAINLAINTNDPVFAVNGPPGTGKTTLLKEIVAENVVQRARILSEYEKPDQMFVSRELHLGNTRRYYYLFRPDMKDIKRYGIVVASSNNNAVENISKQLPLIETLEKNLMNDVDDQTDLQRLFSLENAPLESAMRTNFEKEGSPREKVEFPDIYFSCYATDLLREPCWGLISAPLGKKSNIYAFYKKVLSSLKWDRYLQGAPGSRMQSYLKARDEFQKQYKIVEMHRKKLQAEVADAEKRGLSTGGEGDGKFVCLSERLLDDLSSENPDIRKKAQMSCVRLSKRYDEEREKLFWYALRLTKEFILSSEACKANLQLLSMAWGVETYLNVFSNLESGERELKLRECMTPLIQTLQLMVPVISTTFASAGRFFKYVTKADALGTIVVDEAGQATPQMAISLFSKASRAIIVGDPNQIDPVVSDELAFLESTLDDSIGNAYSDRTISVQKIADYLSTYGSEQFDILGRFGKKWVGLPLYVHSRCIEPMFSISNRLSYGDTMLSITGNPGSEKQFCYGVSQWLNVSGEAESDKNHFVRAQGERVIELLETAFETVALTGDEAKIAAGPDIFVISPFHTVAEGMRNLLSNSFNANHPILLQNREMVENWLMDDQNPHIGTVHTFQGREADEVILLLGCDEKSKRSANWVNRNIINVAVSRAKYRLYAIGDVKAWRGCDPVMEMKFDLDAHQFNQLAEAASSFALDEDDEKLFEIPELPSSELFDISDITDENEPGETEYVINTDSSIGNVRAAVPGLAMDFTSEQLKNFGLTSMDEFESLFDDKTKDLLRTGMWIYTWIDQSADTLPDNYDASFVGICFCKAYEQILKQNYFVWLQQLFPDETVQGKKIATVSPESVMIGDVTTIISSRARELAIAMDKIGCPECDIEWWSRLSKRLRKCKDYRNKCAHPGAVFHWNELRSLITQLFIGYEENEKHYQGLMFDRTFRQAISTKIDHPLQQDMDAIKQSMQAARDEQYKDSMFKYYPMYCKVHICPADRSNLVQELFEVRNKLGKKKKLNMLRCRKCDRKFINIYGIGSISLDDYYLEPQQQDW